MKAFYPFHLRHYAAVLAAAVLMFATTARAQTTYYWDSNGPTAGFGNTTGTWGTDAFWSTDAAGTSATSNPSITTLDTVHFGTAALNYANVTVSGPAAAQGFLNMNFGAGQTTALTISGGTLNLAANSTITQSSTSANMAIGSLLEGSGSALTKTGPGALTLSGNNTFTGGVTLTGNGALNLAHSNAVGTGTILLKSTQTSFPTTLGISGGITVANAIQIDSTTGRESLSSTGTGDNAFTGGITVTGNGTNFMSLFNNQSSGNLTISGGITGTGGFAGGFGLRGTLAGNTGFLNGAVNTPASYLGVGGATTWTLNTAGSNYTYLVLSSNGSARLGVNDAIATNAYVTWTSNSTTGALDLNGFNQSVAGLDANTGANGNNTVTNNGTSDSILTLAGLTANRTFAGVIKDGATNKVSLVLNSAGSTQTLSGANTFTGGITLLGNGSLDLAHSNAAGTGTILLKSTQTGPVTTLGLSGGIAVANAIQIDSTTGRESLSSTGTGDNALTGGITITGGNATNFMSLFNNQSSGNLTISGGITGTGGFAGGFGLRGSLAGNTGFLNGAVNTPASSLGVGGATTWTLNTAGSNYTYLFLSNNGSARLGVNDAIATNAYVTWTTNSTTGALDLNGFNQSVAGLDANYAANGNNTVTNNGASDSILTLAELTANRTFAGVITDGATNKVSLVLNSAGRTQTLSGNNTHTGDTTITAGTLQVDGSTAAGSTVGVGTAGTLTGTGTINGNATLTGSGIIDKSSGTIAGTLSVTGGHWNGNGAVTGAVTSSSGTFTIGSGANLTTAGGLSVTGGSIAAGNTASTLSGNLNYTSTSNSTFQGVIAGTGNTVTMNSTALLTLSGNNTFTGGVTLLSNGTLNLAHSNAAGTGTIFLKSTQTSFPTTLGISGGITVANAIEIDSTTGRECITSTGTGNNALTGGITITGNVSRTVIFQNNQTSGNLTISGGISAPSFPGFISLRGSSAGAAGFLNGAINAPSVAIDSNSVNTWTLNTAGSNYTNFILRNSGSVRLGVDNAMATNAYLSWISNSTTGALDLNGFNQSIAGLDANFTANGNNTVTNNGASDSILTLAELTENRTFAGLIKDGATNKVSLVLNNAGRTQTLSGANTFTGGVTLTGNGALHLAHSSAAGTGTILLKSTQTSFPTTLGLSGGITVANAIEIDSTTGRETIASTGTGNNELTGGITITGGNTTNLMSLFNNQSSGNLTISGGITGTGGFAGGFRLRGYLAGNTGFLNGVVNTPASYLGVSEVTTWTLNTAGSNYTRFFFRDSGNARLGVDNAIATNAYVSWEGDSTTGALDLNGFNQSVAGLDDQFATNGNHTVTNNGASDSILTLAGLTENRTFAGVIKDGATNKVSLVMNSAGRTQTLSGNNTYSGGTIVNEGILSITGQTVAREFVVNPLGTLAGNGLIIGNVRNTGVVAPGNSPGTLRISGNYEQATTGALNIEIASASNFDRLVVSDQITLAGTLNLIPYGGYIIAPGSHFDFLQAASITGNFSSIIAPEGLRGRFLISGGVGTLLFAPQSFVPYALNQNQRRVAEALDGFILATDGDRLAVSIVLDSLTTEQFPYAFDQIMPGFYESLANMAIEQAFNQTQMLNQRISSVRLGAAGFQAIGGISQPLVNDKNGKKAAEAKEASPIVESATATNWNSWALGTGMFSRSTDLGSLQNYNNDAGGFLVGADYRWSENFVTGLYGGYDYSYAEYNGGGSTKGNSFSFGTYASYAKDGYYADAVIGGGYTGFQTQRSIEFSTIDRTASADPNSGQFTAGLNLGKDFEVGQFTLGPIVGAQYTYAGIGSFTESGAESLDLSLGQQNANSLRSTLGGRIAYTWNLNQKIALIPEVRIFWQHEFLNNPRTITAALDGGNGPAFGYETTDPYRNSVFAGAGVTAQFGKNLSGSVFYNINFGSQTYQSNMVSAGLNFAF